MKTIYSSLNTDRTELIFTADFEALEDSFFAERERLYKESTRFLPEVFYRHPFIGGGVNSEKLTIIKEDSDSEILAWIDESPEWQNLDFAKNRRVIIWDDGSRFDPEIYDLSSILKKWWKYLTMKRAYFVGGGLFDTKGKFYLLTPEGEVYTE
jgi:hypothetical protein